MKSLKLALFFIFAVGCGFFFWPKESYKPKVYDCFLFYNELELLDMRLHEMYEHVDKFVLVEACETFRGKPKPFYYAENKHLFEKFADKIIHVQITEPLQTDDPWIRERHQRAQAALGLKESQPDDIVFISDLDEIIRGTSSSTPSSSSCSVWKNGHVSDTMKYTRRRSYVANTRLLV